MSRMTKTIAALGVVAGLGVAALPLSSYAVDAATTNIPLNVKVVGAIAISPDADYNGGVQLTTTMEQNTTSETMTAGFRVFSSTAYDLGIYGIDTATTDGTGTGKTALTHETDSTATIPALTVATADLATIAANTAGWGYKLVLTDTTNLTADATNYTTGSWNAVKAANTTVATSTGSSDTNGDHVSIQFGIKTADNQKEGTYSGGVTVVATAHAEAPTEP